MPEAARGVAQLYPSPICFTPFPFSLSLSFSFALPLRWTRFYFLLCCEFINKTCICDTRARNIPTRRGEGEEGVAGQIPAREQKPEAMHRRRLAACPCLTPPSLAPPLLLFLPHVAVCEKLRLAFWACFSFGADIYFAVVNFKLPSHFATCNLPHAPCHLPLACHAAIGRTAQRSAAQRAHQFPQAPPG